MVIQHERTPELRRFLVINFLVGNRENGYLIGPVLVSTRDYKRFHYWNEPSSVVLQEDDYEVVKVYQLGLSYDEVSRRFSKDFPSTVTGPARSAGWVGPDGIFYSAEGWTDLGQHPILVA